MAGISAIKFREDLESIIDSPGVHHEFSRGMHGRKIDFDKISDESQLYQDWLAITEGTLRERYSPLPEVIVGVANGTNRVSRDLARRLGIVGLETYKPEKDPRTILLSMHAMNIIRAMRLRRLVVIEDVGTTGSNSVQPALAARDQLHVPDVSVLLTWQRRSHLELLDGADIPYGAIINDEQPTYSPEECASDGYCAAGWQLIPHSRG